MLFLECFQSSMTWSYLLRVESFVSFHYIFTKRCSVCILHYLWAGSPVTTHFEYLDLLLPLPLWSWKVMVEQTFLLAFFARENNLDHSIIAEQLPIPLCFSDQIFKAVMSTYRVVSVTVIKYLIFRTSIMASSALWACNLTSVMNLLDELLCFAIWRK